MKTNITLQSLAIFTGVALLAGASSARAQVYAYDDASGYTGAWLFGTTTNGGYGFTPWVFTKVGSDYQGFYRRLDRDLDKRQRVGNVRQQRRCQHRQRRRGGGLPRLQ
jgi:hypothetical protein